MAQDMGNSRFMTEISLTTQEISEPAEDHLDSYRSLHTTRSVRGEKRLTHYPN